MHDDPLSIVVRYFDEFQESIEARRFAAVRLSEDVRNIADAL